MDKTQTDIPEYIKKLPQQIQDLIFDGTWESRVREIAKKYSLSEAQTDSLENCVLFVLISLDTPDSLLPNITSEVLVSSFVAEQIIDDLNARVFEFALSFIQNKEKKQSNSSIKSPEIKTETKVPEIRPQNLPMVEKNEKVKVNIPPTNTTTNSVPKFVPNLTPNKNMSVAHTTPESIPGNNVSKIVYKPVTESKPIETPKVAEFVQRPVNVPRFVGLTMDENGNTIQNPLVPKQQEVKAIKSIMDEKLKTPAREIIPEVKPIVPSPTITPTKAVEPVSTPEPTSTPPTHSYVIDPYREPLE